MPVIYLLKTETPMLNVIAVKSFQHYRQIVLIDFGKYTSDHSNDQLTRFLTREGLTITTLQLDPYQPAQLKHFQQQLQADDLFVFPNIRFAYALSFYELAKDCCQIVFVEEDGDLFCPQTTNGLITFQESNRPIASLDLDDFLAPVGASLMQTSEALVNEPAAKAVFNHIMAHLDTYRKMMKPTPPIKTHAFAKNLVSLTIDRLSPAEIDLLESLVDIMNRFGKCSKWLRNYHGKLKFFDLRYKEYLGKSGTWLEHLSYTSLAEINDFNDAKVSVLFSWHPDYQRVKNEIDVMGIYQHHLVLVSCKDTHHLNEETLYELYTHSQELGNKTAKKILVTTTYPTEAYLKRAKDLDIHLVPFIDDLALFKKQLIQALAD